MSVVASAPKTGAPAVARRPGAIAATLVAVCLAAALATPSIAFAIIPPVSFADANLAAKVRIQLGLAEGAPITQSDLNGLTTLDAHSSSISSLSGLEFAANLTSLQIYDNNITDITPLVGTTSLSVLGISQNHVADLTPLQGITTLHWLNAGSNDITSLAPLSGLTNLQYLDVNNNSISSVTPLSGLTNLSALMLYHNPTLSDLSPLSGLTSLQTLYAGQNATTDISPLSGLTNLRDLDLGYSAIPDITPLSGLTNLKSLGLYSNGTLVDISALAPLTHLEFLNVAGSHIYDLSPLASLNGTSPSIVYIGRNWLDLSPGSETSQIIAGMAAKGYVVNDSGQRSGGAIAGTVTSPSGTPLSGVSAALAAGPRALTSASGAYAIGLARPGDRTLTFSKPYFTSKTVTLTVTEGFTTAVSATLIPIQIALNIVRSPGGSSLSYKRKRGVAKFTLSATLSDARGKVRGQRVWLQKSTDGRSWKTVTKVATNSVGKASVTLRFKKRQAVYYRWYAPQTVYNFSKTTSRQRVRIK